MLVVKKLNKGFIKKVINNFSYEFKTNTIYAITGPSGCGKSTLLAILANNDKHYQGEVYFQNKLLKESKNYTFLDVGYVYQSYQLFDKLTAYENVILPLKLLDDDYEKVKFKVQTLFKKFNIAHLLNTKVKDLSGGEKQRVAIIRALIKEPKVLLLDEPTSALDEQTTNLLLSHLKSIKENKIIIMVTHNEKLASLCDEIICLNQINKQEIPVIKKVPDNSKKIKFKSVSYLQKKVFKNKKIFNYIATSILSFGLLGFLLSNLLTSFINNVVSDSLSVFNNSGNVTFKEKNTNNVFDYSTLEKDYDCLYYEGLESSFKEKIKHQNQIVSISFNSHKINDPTFIFDNYLNTNDDLLTLSVPLSYQNLIGSSNTLTLSLNSKDLTIKIDQVYLDDSQQFSLYCNNVNYLKDYFSLLGINVSLTKLLYGGNYQSLYDYLLTSDKYASFTFYLDEDSQVIYIFDSPYRCFNENTLNSFIKDNQLNYYLVSDLNHTLIDYDSGFIYLLINNEATLVSIDNTLADNEVKISKKYQEIKNISNNIILFKQTFKIKKITKENNYALIYLNAKTFNSFNEERIYVGLINLNDNTNIINKQNFLINNNLFQMNSFEVFTNINNFLEIFSTLLILQAIIASFFIFVITFASKQKEVTCLLKLGLYPENALYLLLYEPVTNILSAILSALFSGFMAKFLIAFIYNHIANTNISLTFSFLTLLLVIILPFVLILPLIILKIFNFLKKYLEK